MQEPISSCLEHKDVYYLRPVVGLICGLSLLGSFIVILTYFLNKENQTIARTILVHISVGNIGQVVASLVGIFGNLNHYSKAPWWSDLCQYQGAATVYFNVCTMLWTTGLAVHLFLLILSKKNDVSHFVKCLSVLCYLMPLLITAWLKFSSKLGSAPLSIPGYCGLKGLTYQNYSSSHGEYCILTIDYVGDFFGYNLWVILTIGVILLLYISALCHLKLHVRATKLCVLFLLCQFPCHSNNSVIANHLTGHSICH